MSRFGVDYSFARPSPEGLVRAGVTFVYRYLWPRTTGSKGIDHAELVALRHAGIDVVFGYEEAGYELLGGKPAGVRVARAAKALLGGLTDTPMPIIFSADFDPAAVHGYSTAAALVAVGEALRGAASVLGRDRVWLYGGHETVRYAFDHGLIGGAMQTYAWSGGLWDPRAAIQQYHNAQWGGTVDFDRAVKEDFGQWPIGYKPPKPEPQPTVRMYTVRRGDTLSRIAEDYHTTVSRLIVLNHLPDNGNLIYPGQTLKV